MPARVTFEILRPVPVAELVVDARVVRPGRSVELLDGELKAGGETVMTVRAWRVKATGAETVADQPPPPRPADATPPPPGLDGVGGGPGRSSSGSRPAAGTRAGPATVWTRLRVPVVVGEEPAPAGAARARRRRLRQRRVPRCSRSASGCSSTRSSLSTSAARRVGEWICLDAETTISRGGAGFARSVLSDDYGVGRPGAQSLLVQTR